MKMNFKYWRLYLSNLSGFLSYMSFGAIVAYPSPAFPTMRFGEKPLSLSMTSWLVSFSGLFAIPGCLIVIPFMDKYGRKSVMIATPIVMSIGWLLGVCAYNVATEAVSRAITGLGVGMELGCLFVYIAEISPKDQRGIIAAILSLTVSFGALLVNFLENFIDWRWNTLVCLGVSLDSNVTSFFIYETPRWLISKGQRTAAIETMRKLWLIDEDQLKREADDIEYNVKLVSNCTYFQTLIQIFKPPLWKPLIISQLLIALQQLTGTAYINSYTVQIFNEAGLVESDTHTGGIHFDNPYYQSTLVWFAFLIGSILSFFIIDRFGRRVLLISNTACIVLAFIGTGVYYYLKDLRPELDLHEVRWIPVTSLLIYSFCSGAGIIAILYLMLSEMFPIATRSVAMSLGIVSRNLLFFLVAKVFTTPNLLPTFGIYWIFAGFGLLGLVFVIFFVPETKGRTLEEIQMQWYVEKKAKNTNSNF